MIRFRVAACCGAWALALGCGGGQEPAKNPALVTAPTPTAATVAEDPPDLSPVAAPSDLVVAGRFKNSRLAVDTVSKWIGLPVSIPELLPEDARATAKLIDFEAPVEVAVALDPRGEGKVPQPLAVVSVGLVSLSEAVNAARASGATVRRVQPGVFRTSLADPLSCALSASVGRAPARLVCGDRWKDVEELLGYATRGLPTEALGEADLVAELAFEPIQRRYSRDLAGARLLLGLALREIELDSPRFDRSLADLAYAAADELVALVNDLDRIRLEATIDQKREELSFSGSLKFKGETSWTVQTLQAIPYGPAPRELFRMPEGMTEAWFGYGAPQERFDPLGRALSELAEGYLEAQKLPRASRERWRKLVERLFKLGGTSVRGQGDFPVLSASDPLARNALAEYGWGLIYVPNRPSEVKAFFSDLVAALEDPAFKKLLKDKFDLDEKLLPRWKKRTINVPGFKGPGLLVEGTFTPELMALLEFFFQGDEKKTHGKLVFVIVPDGAGTWIGDAGDEKRLLAKLAELHGDPSKRHAALRPFEQMKAVSGGFGTLRGVLSNYDSLTKHKSVEQLVAPLPHHGETPLIGFARIVRAGPATTASMNVALPRGFFADLAALAPVLASESTLSGPAAIVAPPTKSP